MAPERLMLVATHTHAGPVSNPHEPNGKCDLEWLHGLAHKIAEAILRAALRLRPAKVGVVRGVSKVAMNRQQTFEDGSVNLGAAPERPTDTEVIAVVVDSPDGRPIARIVNYNCHNTTLGPRNSRLSADYAGQAMSAVEAEIGQAVCAFVNGGAGNADPFHRVLDDADDPRAREVADTFTRDVRKTLAGDAAFGADARVAGAFHDIDLPRKLCGVEAGLGRFQRIRAQGLLIAQVLLVGSPNEVVCEIAGQIKKQSPVPQTLFASYCCNAVGPWHPGRDGVGGYLPAAAHYDFGGYEVRVSPYSAEAEAVYTRQVLQLADRLAAAP
jgi:hypothetical protein